MSARYHGYHSLVERGFLFVKLYATCGACSMGRDFAPGRRSATTFRLNVDPAEFLGELAVITNDDDEGNEQIGVLALEILPISMRLITPPLYPGAILAQHSPNWENFMLVSHSYGSVLTTHVLYHRHR
ncbi:hypothetical protein B0H63DRAFT_536330 [Podospora didyma]|uniref:Uncharacterized protein n=1 Tax=Podospora didyma TaxID=330526 RepID=A0AAE0JXY1_9PEZI|nr:hypothetical protein B0H63DRAFT_536330 [Podospora didyma]